MGSKNENQEDKDLGAIYGINIDGYMGNRTIDFFVTPEAYSSIKEDLSSFLNGGSPGHTG